MQTIDIKKNNLINFKMTNDINFFMLKENNSIKKFIFIESIVKKFIIKKIYDSSVQNVNFTQVYRRCLLRRIHASRIFFNSSISIESNLFKMKIVIINFRFEMIEMRVYKMKKLKFMNDIIALDKKKSKSK